MNADDKSFMTNFTLVLGSLVLLAIIFFFVAQAIVADARKVDEEKGPDAETLAMLEERIQPVGAVKVRSTSGDIVVERSAEEIYSAVCASCHAAGVLGAPALGDEATWGQRLDELGLNGLVANAINGKGAMPPRGGDMSLSDNAVQNVVIYMLAESGHQVTAASAASAASSTEVIEAAAAQPLAESAPSEPKTDAKTSLAAARAALQQAEAAGFAWRDTGKLIKQAEEAAAAGDEERAIKLAGSAKRQSENALEQAKRAGVEPTKAEPTAAAAPADEADVGQALSAARAALKEAEMSGFAWRDTGKLIKQAEEAAAAGDNKRALQLAQSAKLQSENAIKQAAVAGVESTPTESAASTTGEAMAPAIGFDQALADAKAALKAAEQTGFAWRDTGKLIGKAEAAAEAGDEARATEIALIAKRQSENALKQAKRAGAID